MPRYETILFDSDGVLVEPPARETQVEATRAAFRAVGVDDPNRRDVLEIVDGVTVDGLEAICRTYDLDPGAFWEARERHDEMSQFDAFDAGARDRYDDVASIADLAQSRDCGVVSNNHHSTIEYVLERFDLQSAFGTYYGREKTIESLRLKKPNAHYLERALDDLEGDPESTLYVGDSESDVVAAARAGMDSAFVRRSHCRDVELSVSPTYEVTDLHEIAALVAE